MNAAPSSDGGAPAPRRRWPIVLGVVAALVLGAVVAIMVYANVPNEARVLDPAASVGGRELNTLIATSLLVGGISEPFVDVTPERALVTFERPNATAENGTDEFLQQFVLGATARAAPSCGSIIVVQSVEGTARLMWKVETATVNAFFEGSVTEEALLAAIEKTVYDREGVVVTG